MAERIWKDVRLQIIVIMKSIFIPQVNVLSSRKEKKIQQCVERIKPLDFKELSKSEIKALAKRLPPETTSQALSIRSRLQVI